MARQKAVKTVFLLLLLSVSSCTSVPKGVIPVNDFELERYLGTWYEIARLDHSFERGMDNVTANYSLTDDGSVNVVNRGYRKEDNAWEQATGNAVFVGDKRIGHLKVSFFGPFYASYVIAQLDKKGYQYAMVTGPDTDFLWLLSRTPDLAPDVLDTLLEQAKALGFAVDELIYVSHAPAPVAQSMQ